MSKYTHFDVNQAFEFAKANPDKSIEDFYEFRSKTLHESEREHFKNITYFKSKLKDLEFYVFRSNTENLSNFVSKFVGNRGYFDLIPADNYGYSYCVIIFDDIDTDNWDKDYKKFKGLYFLENQETESVILYDLMEDDDELVFERYDRFRRNLDRDYYHFWYMEDRINLYIKSFDKFEFKSALELFEN